MYRISNLVDNDPQLSGDTYRVPRTDDKRRRHIVNDINTYIGRLMVKFAMWLRVESSQQFVTTSFITVRAKVQASRYVATIADMITQIDDDNVPRR